MSFLHLLHNTTPLYAAPPPVVITPRYYQNDAVDSIFNYYATIPQDKAEHNPVVVMPTGTGKSIVIGEFVKRVLLRWPRQRLICLTHVKELIDQNVEKLRALWPLAPVGIYSDGLNQRDVHHPIIYGGIASAIKCPERFGHRDLLLVDEAHMIGNSEAAQYRQMIVALRKINPYLRVVGFTATDFRMGQGRLTEGDDRLFTDVCCNYSSLQWFNRFIDEGYLCNLVVRGNVTQINTDDIRIIKGDFDKKEVENAADSITVQACRDILGHANDRHSWMVFASGTKHVFHVAEELQSLGINAVGVTGKSKDRDDIIKRFRKSAIHALVVYGIGGVGFDVPQVDLIADMQPGMSVVRHVQKYGRGVRPLYSPGYDLDSIQGRLLSIANSRKPNCVGLDFAGNRQRCGPINDPIVPRPKGKGAPGDAPVKLCPKCGAYNATRATICCDCAYVFPTQVNISPTAGTDELIRREEPVYNEFHVANVSYTIKQKDNNSPYVQAEYFVLGQKPIYDRRFPYGGASQRSEFRAWWRQRTDIPVPDTIDEVMKHLSQLTKPKMIRVWTNRLYPQVTACQF